MAKRADIAAIRKEIRSLAADSSNVAFSHHALERSDQRGITTLDAIRVLQRGDIAGTVEPGRKADEWKCKVVANIRGSRDIGVVTLVMTGKRLLVITVEWEDLR